MRRHLHRDCAGRRGPDVIDTRPLGCLRCFTLLFRIVWGGLFVALDLTAAPPVLDQIFPAAIQVGISNSVTAVGTFDPWPPQVWTDTPGLTLIATTNHGIFRVESTADTPLGPHLIRLFNSEGASAVRFLILAQERQVAEMEPNDSFAHPQPIDVLPATINGRLEKSGDVDSYAVDLKAGQTLIASVEAYTLQSPIDAALFLLDARGIRMAQNHDDGRTLDPALIWTAQADGRYIVQVFGFDYPAGSDVRFAGNARCIYRLHLSNGPHLSHTLPLGVGRGTDTTLRLSGWNLPASMPQDYHLGRVEFPSDKTEVVIRSPGFDGSLRLPIGMGPEILEREPNNLRTHANPLEIPSAVTGTIGEAGDVDYYSFSAKEGELLLFDVQSASFGFPLDPWLKIEDANGKELVRMDDGSSADPSLEWKSPSGTHFFAVVGGLLHRGGPEYLYRLSVTRPEPTVKTSVAEDAFSVTAGKTNELKLSVTRKYGHGALLKAVVKGLPTGVTAVVISPSSWSRVRTRNRSAARFRSRSRKVLRDVKSLPGGNWWQREKTTEFPRATNTWSWRPWTNFG
jgi:hypothetical protein